MQVTPSVIYERTQITDSISGSVVFYNVRVNFSKLSDKLIGVGAKESLVRMLLDSVLNVSFFIFSLSPSYLLPKGPNLHFKSKYCPFVRKKSLVPTLMTNTNTLLCNIFIQYVLISIDDDDDDDDDDGLREHLI